MNEPVNGAERAGMTVREQWDEFERQVVPPQAGAAQRRQMRLAFYGGVAGLLAMQLAIPSEDEDVSVARYKAWSDECQAFANDYVAEQAAKVAADSGKRIVLS